MKPAKYFIHILLPLILWACSGNAPSNPALLHAARLLDENPDSADVALRTLDTINVEAMTEFDRNYHTLLTVKAHDKLYMPHNGDSAILNTVEFFNGRGAGTYHTVNSRRSRLRKKIGTGDISPDDLDAIIRNL